MAKETLYNAARRYIEIIEAMEKTHDKEKLVSLEEERVVRHNDLIELLRQAGVSFKDREHVTRIAYALLGEAD